MTIDGDALPATTSTEASADTQAGTGRRLDVLDHVPLGVEVVLGRTTMLFRELRELQVGEPIELERAANQPVDVLVNGAPFAKGEVVVINGENLGVRITEILRRGDDGL